jgi:hypothetical protein
MSGTLSESTDRRSFFILMGAGILILAVIIAIPLLRSLSSQGAIEQAPAAVEEKAPDLYPPQVRRDLLERELKEAWRAQILLQGAMSAAAARDASGLERDVKDAARVNLAAGAAVTSASPGLEQDLKAPWHTQMRANHQASGEDRSGLERDLKALWHAVLATLAP